MDSLRKIISPNFTEEVLQSIIERKTGSNFQIDNYEILESADGNRKGDAYLSNLTKFSIVVHGHNSSNTKTTLKINVITKYLLTNIARRKTFRSIEFFENEAAFYEKVWPAFQQFQNSKNISQDKFDNIPVYLYGFIDGKSDFIALEDLSYDGYESMDRSKGMDIKHTTEVLKIFAEFHAIALAYKDQKPNEFSSVVSNLKETYFSEKQRGWYSGFLQNILIGVIRDALEKELADPKYVEKYNKFVAGDYFGRVCKLCVDVNDPLAVVTHGDSWIPNFLVKYNDEEKTNIAKIILIDFQLARYANLGNDLTFFLLTCVDVKVLQKHWDDLITSYWQYLVDYLGKLGSKKDLVTLEAVKKNVSNSIVFGLAMSMEAICMSLLEDNEIFDMESLEGDEAVPLEVVWNLKPFKDSYRRERIASVVKFVFDNEYFKHLD